MRLSQFCVLSAVGILCLPSSVFAAPATLQPKTAAAVIAADEGWLKAEETGDTAYVDNLLLPEYRSVNADGSVHDKAAILASAHKNVGSTARTLADEKWLAAHPMGTAVLIQGDCDLLSQAARSGEGDHVERYLRLPRRTVARNLLATHGRGKVTVPPTPPPPVREAGL
jgi:hypothetical protein